MDKKTQMILGVGVLAVAGYLIYKGMQPKNLVGADGKIFANATSSTSVLSEALGVCPCKKVKATNTLKRDDGTTVTETVCMNDSPSAPHRCYA